MERITLDVRDLVAKYAKQRFGSAAFLIENTDKNLFGILAFDFARVDQPSSVKLLVRILGALIVVDCDHNETPFYESLLQAGVARTQIALRYANEVLSDEDISNMLYERFMHELKLYAQDPMNARSYLTSCKTDAGELFAIISMGVQQNKYSADAGLIVEWRKTAIIIHLDGFYPTFSESLVDLGIPRERIILAYAGETIPTADERKA